MGNESSASPSVGERRAHPGHVPALQAGGKGHISAGPWNWLWAPACPAWPLGELFLKQSLPPPRLNGRFTSKSYSQINSINLGDSHFITPGSSVHCLPQGEAVGAGKGWENQLLGELEHQDAWPGPAPLWDSWGHGWLDLAPAPAAHLGFLRLC